LKLCLNSSLNEIANPRRKNYNRGMTEAAGIGNVNARVKKDVEDMIDENQDSDNEESKRKRNNDKGKMKKIKNKEAKKPGMNKGGSNVKEKLARAQEKIKKMMNSNQDKGDPTANLNEGGMKLDKEANAQIISKLTESENNHGDLTFGSYIVLNIEKDAADPRKFSTKFRISDKVQSIKMEKEDYDENCVFRIIPSAQTALLSKLRKSVTEDNIPPNVNIDYENFISEMEANVDLQEDFMGKPVKYGSKFQLVQESSKRFMCIHEAKNTTVKKIFDDKYIDSN
jgi:hypothetical protein